MMMEYVWEAIPRQGHRGLYQYRPNDVSLSFEFRMRDGKYLCFDLR